MSGATLPKAELTNISYLRYLNFERIPAMNQAIPLANPGLTLDGVIVERPIPKEAIITIKIRSFIILYLLIFFCL